RAAREHGIPTVQRIFSIDSQATKTSANAAGNYHPSYIEIMPGVIPKVIRHFCGCTDIPIIAGGLIETADEVSAAIESGAVAVSTANKDLW
ncbi:MAG: glycerol-3-phosphate responsive antiterminator, partial [Ruminococcaceae bacterium]|nr:glycerol-3-phosphate responsive antiterminator [Oscillospiraceae bacterium]